MLSVITKSIKLKISLVVILIMIVISFAIIIYTSVNTGNYARSNALEISKFEAEKFASIFKTKIDEALSLSRNLSSVFASVKSRQYPVELSREEANTIIRDLTEKNKGIIGAFVAWIPDNSFDGKDKLFANIPGNCPTGRYNTYYTWSQGKVTKQPETEWDYEAASDYFLKPKEKLIECIIDPYYYPVDGKDVLMVSLPSPIIAQNEFKGVTSVDISVSFIQEIANSANIFNNTGIVSIISNNGTIAGVTRHPQFIGKNIDSLNGFYKINDLKSNVAQGKSYSLISDTNIVVLVPLRFGNTDTPWAVLVQVPLTEPMSTANKMINFQILISVLLSLGAIIILFFLIGKFIKPLKILNDSVNKIKDGVLDLEVNINQKDEIGQLANSFKEMSSTLNSIIKEVNNMGHQLENGKLDFRANSSDYKGVFAEMIDSMNYAINAIVRPLNVAAEYVDRISKGDIPPKITDDYKGDFNEIKNNLNQCIDSINLLLKDTYAIVDSATAGRLTDRANSNKHLGDFRKVISGFNSTMDRLVGLIDNLPVPVQIVDKDFQVLYLNNTAQKINE